MIYGDFAKKYSLILAFALKIRRKRNVINAGNFEKNKLFKILLFYNFRGFYQVAVKF